MLLDHGSDYLLSFMRMAAEGLPPAARLISSPDDLDAHDAKQHTTAWIGDQVHFTESGEAEEPPLMTHVATTAGPMAEAAVTSARPEALQAKQLRPSLHRVETGYLDAALRVTSQQAHGVERLGPTRPDGTWQAQAGQGLAASHLTLAGAQEPAICPRGRPRLSWTPAVDRRDQAVINMKFSMRDGQPCASRARCIRAARRTVTGRPQEQHLSLQAARQDEQTAASQAEYAKRAGIEGTISQAVRAVGVRRARSRGAAKTPLHPVVTAAAINGVRVGTW